MMIVARIIALLIGYGFGLFQTGYLYGKSKGIDIRQQGSGNAGTTNSLRVLGWKAGIITFAGDLLKAVFAVLLVKLIFHGTYGADTKVLELYAGFGTVLGHNFPCYLQFRGGKGIACTTGVILAVCPPAVICCAVGFLIIVGITRYVSVGSIFLVSAYLVQAIIFGQIGWLKISGASRIEFYILSACFTGMAIWRHRANIVRLMNGTENKFGTKKGDKDMAKVGVIGAGSWGIALAKLLRTNGNEVTVWSIVEEEVAMLRREHEHIDKLPGVKLPEDVLFTTDLKEAIVGKEFLILAVPSVFTRSTAKSMAGYVTEGQIIVCVAKGIEEDTLMTISDVTEQEIPCADVAVMCGPSHAEEVGIGLPTTVVAGAKTESTAKKIQDLFMNEVFRVYTSPDMLGMELGGSLKNVIALAAGMADGLGYGDNTKAALITRGIAEIAGLAVKMGAKVETLCGLTGIGDLIVTCESRHSRNRKAGMLIGQGYTMKQATDEVKMVVEGIYSAKAALALAKKYDVELPIIEEVNKVLFDDKPTKEGVKDLMVREKRVEHLNLKWEN